MCHLKKIQVISLGLCGLACGRLDGGACQGIRSTTLILTNHLAESLHED